MESRQNFIPRIFNFYRAMHFSEKHGLAITCRLSIHLSICDGGS